MSVYSSKPFWVSTFERAIKTAAQVTAGTLTLDLVTGPTAINWGALGALAGVTALYSVLSSIGSAAVPGSNPGPSLADETLSPPAVPVEPPKE